MISLSTSEHQEAYEGIPCIYMPESAEKLEGLLLMIYHERCVTCTAGILPDPSLAAYNVVGTPTLIIWKLEM